MPKISKDIENRIVKLTEQGYSTQQISEMLHVSRPTIRRVRFEQCGIQTNIKNIMSQIEVDERYKQMRQGQFYKFPRTDLVKCLQIVRLLNQAFFDKIHERRWVVDVTTYKRSILIIRVL